MDVDNIVKMVNEVDKLKEAIEDLQEEIDAEKQRALEADGHLSDWEDRLRACRETHSLVSQEKARDGEVEHLRVEVHKMQVKGLFGNVTLINATI